MHSARCTRRSWLQSTAAVGAGLLGGGVWGPPPASAAGPTGVIDLGGRRELLVDEFLVERMPGVVLRMHRPAPHDVALTCDAPWEGNTSAYFTLFADQGRFRAYYRGSHFDESRKRAAHPEVTCYAESADGRVWTKPKLGLCDFAGSKENNIVWTGVGTHNFTPFKDGNSACAPQARYKALAGGNVAVDGKQRPCLYAYQSPDGLRWSRLGDAPVITAGAFDSQNLAYWDAVRGEYRAYWRIFSAGVRAIRTATSKDFLHWENQADLTYVDSPAEHLYTNAIDPYFRAPHLFLGLPTRFQPKTQQVEPVLMTSRDGVRFRRWPEELIPITAPQDRAGNRSNYMARGVLALPGNDRELSVYGTEAYYQGPASRLRRFTFRTDGFVSATAVEAGELLSKPLVFAGKELSINARTARGGSLRVEVQDAAGKPLPGYAAADCQAFAGDAIDHRVCWQGGNNVGSLAGMPIRLRFVLSAADLFALQFVA